MQKKLAGISLYGPTEMIDGDFPWVKRCWLVAVARGLLEEEYHGSSVKFLLVKMH